MIETFEYENTKSDFKFCNNREKWKEICQNTAKYTRAWIQEVFSDIVAPDIDGFTDEPVVQCDSQVVRNAFVDDFKWMMKR